MGNQGAVCYVNLWGSFTGFFSTPEPQQFRTARQKCDPRHVNSAYPSSIHWSTLLVHRYLDKLSSYGAGDHLRAARELLPCISDAIMVWMAHVCCGLIFKQFTVMSTHINMNVQASYLHRGMHGLMLKQSI